MSSFRWTRTAGFVAIWLGMAALALAQSDYIPVQGRLTNAGGTPLNGAYSLTFRMYDIASGGSPLCTHQVAVTVTQGLFSTYFQANDCSIDGRQLYLGVEVGTDGEMSPRFYIDNAAYAFGLRPGSSMIGSYSQALLHIENSAATGRALRAYAMSTSGTNYGVIGASKSPDGYGGYFYNNSDGIALRAVAEGASGRDAIEAESESGDGVSGEGQGITARGVYATNSAAGIALAARANSTGNLYPTAYLVQENATGNFLIGASAYWGTRYFRIDRTGKGFFEGGTQTGGADFAERLDVRGDAQALEPGDVLVISASADRAVELAATPFSTAVIGVYSTRPGVLAGASDSDDPMRGVPVAITGIVPCKATAENGAIHRGDLLVSSSIPGHAMRAGLAPAPGTVIGKALQRLESGSGVIEILVHGR